MTNGTASILKITFWNCRGYPWNKGLELHDIANNADIIFLTETCKHEAKRIRNIDGYIIKSIWPHTRINIGQARVACIYNEG